MLNDAEKKLLNSNITRFPMIKAASAALKNCHKCGHGNISIPVLLRTAITRYAKDPDFIEHCRSLFPLPCVIGGIVVK